MSKRKGVSADEKRVRLLDLFYEKKEFFQLKELEKIAPKEKGIVAQSVKDVLQGLVDDGMVESDKIGTSIYFWAFSSKAAANKKRRLEKIVSEIEENQVKQMTFEKRLIDEQTERKDEERREELTQELNELKEIKKDLENKVAKLSNCDSAFVEKLEQNLSKLNEATNRWTDNIFSAKAWCKNKYSMDTETFNKHFGIPEELDYIEI